MLYKRDFYTLILEKSPYRVPHPPPLGRFAPSPTEDLRQMCPLRGFAPPKLKVFRRACIQHMA